MEANPDSNTNADRTSTRDLTAYERASKSKYARNQHCDHCPNCLRRGCDGSTARHHFIHIYREGDEQLQKLLSRAGYPEHPDRDSGV